jgi:uncharacterized protein YecE (DUF72 family)
MEIYIGTSGYSYADWVGTVYPEDTRQNEYLSLYAELFNFVEINFSYYAMPSARVLEGMQKTVDENFRFSLKGHRSMTHEKGEDLQALCSAFKEGTAPLREAGSLVSVLLQFPYSFHYNRDNRMHLDSLCSCLEGLPLHIEFRNTDWFQPRVVTELRKRSIGIVLSDYPALEGLPDFSPRISSPVAYVRFHGRNRENWWTGNNVSRYDYRYSSGELEERVPVLQQLASSASVLLVAFNNHYKGQAVDNARELIGLLEEE